VKIPRKTLEVNTFTKNIQRYIVEISFALYVTLSASSPDARKSRQKNAYIADGTTNFAANRGVTFNLEYCNATI
jgi:hypothetical protein